MLNLIAGIIITATLTCHPMSCEQAEYPDAPDWADVNYMAGILQGEVGNIPTAYDFVAEQLVADALDYHVINQPLNKRWFAWKKPTSATSLAMQAAWGRIIMAGYKLGVPRCQRIGSARDAMTWGYTLLQADWSAANGKSAVYAFGCK